MERNCGKERFLARITQIDTAFFSLCVSKIILRSSCKRFWWLAEGKGWRMGKYVKRVNCIEMDGKYIFGGKHAVGHIEVEIQCCTHDTYRIL